MKMTKYELIELAMKQCALEMNCTPGDFRRDENIITAPENKTGRRHFISGTFFFRMITFGANAVISADKAIHSWLSEYVKGKTGHYLFEETHQIAINKELEKYNKPLIVEVMNPETVSVYSSIHADCSRAYPFNAAAEIPYFNYGQYIPIEEFIIKIQSQFVDNKDKQYILSMLGKVKLGSEVTTTDDGITQKVEVAKGVSLAQQATVKPIVNLRPYRTFTEVAQPESGFLFRVKEGYAALFVADGGIWRNDARQSIKAFLEGEL
jgi:hypothetical protein